MSRESSATRRRGGFSVERSAEVRFPAASVDYELIPDRSLEDWLADIQATNFVQSVIEDRVWAFNIAATESGYKAVWVILEMKKSKNGVWLMNNQS